MKTLSGFSFCWLVAVVAIFYAVAADAATKEDKEKELAMSDKPCTAACTGTQTCINGECVADPCLDVEQEDKGCLPNRYCENLGDDPDSYLCMDRQGENEDCDTRIGSRMCKEQLKCVFLKETAQLVSYKCMKDPSKGTGAANEQTNGGKKNKNKFPPILLKLKNALGKVQQKYNGGT